VAIFTAFFAAQAGPNHAEGRFKPPSLAIASAQAEAEEGGQIPVAGRRVKNELANIGSQSWLSSRN
jgi:hypothetical protein